MIRYHHIGPALLSSVAAPWRSIALMLGLEIGHWTKCYARHAQRDARNRATLVLIVKVCLLVTSKDVKPELRGRPDNKGVHMPACPAKHQRLVGAGLEPVQHNAPYVIREPPKVEPPSLPGSDTTAVWSWPVHDCCVWHVATKNTHGEKMPFNHKQGAQKHKQARGKSISQLEIHRL